ncbi:MAG: hypothetical protein RR704_18240, partial [Stenotrophomonas sp.]
SSVLTPVSAYLRLLHATGETKCNKSHSQPSARNAINGLRQTPLLTKSQTRDQMNEDQGNRPLCSNLCLRSGALVGIRTDLQSL